VHADFVTKGAVVMSHSPIRLVVFDWAGTTVDHGCFAPVQPFVDALAAVGIEITIAEAREPMGLAKRDHLCAILAQSRVAARWHELHRRDVAEADVDMLFHEQFMPRQLQCVRDCCELVPGLLECVKQLRARGVKIATSTGYFAEAARIVFDLAAQRGYRPDFNNCADDVRAGRPAPWMIFRSMEALDIYPPSSVVKVGDTVPDIEEGLNAGAWAVGVTHTSSDVGLTAAQLAALPADERTQRVSQARDKLLAAGAQWVIDSVADLPKLLPAIEDRMESRK
jgi:phosphonoacetaldehyde hydrolase